MDTHAEIPDTHFENTKIEIKNGIFFFFVLPCKWMCGLGWTGGVDVPIGSQRCHLAREAGAGERKPPRRWGMRQGLRKGSVMVVRTQVSSGARPRAAWWLRGVRSD